MIARVMYWPDSTRVGSYVEHILSFRSVFIRKLDSVGHGKPDSMDFAFDGDAPGVASREFLVPMDGSAKVYLMNDGGNTVDSYVWDK